MTDSKVPGPPAQPPPPMQPGDDDEPIDPQVRGAVERGDLDAEEIARDEALERIRGWAYFKRLLHPVTAEDRRTYRVLLTYLRPYLGRVLLSLALSIIGGSLGLGQLMLIQKGLVAISAQQPGGPDAPATRNVGPFGSIKMWIDKHLRGRHDVPTLPGDARDVDPVTFAPPPVQPNDHLAIGAAGNDARDARAQDGGFRATKEDRFSELERVVLLFLLVTLAGALLQYFEEVMMSNVTRKMLRNLREDVFKNLICLPLRFHQRTHSGKLLSRVTKDIMRLRTMMISMTIGLTKEICVFLGALGYALTQTGWAALFALGFVLVAIVPVRIIGDKLRFRDKSAEAGEADLFAMISEVLQGQKIVKAFRGEKQEIRRFRETTKGIYRKQMVTYRLRALTEPMIDTVAGLGIAGGIWFLGGMVIDGRLELAVLATVLVALQKINGSVRRLGKAQNDWVRGIAAADRVVELLEESPELPQVPGAVAFKDIRSDITFDNVTFAYITGQPVLKEVTFTMRRGETLAIVGPSGAGKTSLVDMLPRFYDPEAGAVRIDGTDIREYSLKSLRSRIGIVSQETILFSGTIAENIAYGMKNVTREQVEAAAKAASAYDFIMKKPDGFDTMLGERGSRLSGGERQRVAIARALLKNPPILILDEATSSLDVESESQVQAALETLMQGRTTLVIAHRLSTIRRADRILVVKRGRIKEQGTHEELMALGNRYAKAYRLQLDAMARGENRRTIDEFFDARREREDERPPAEPDAPEAPEAPEALTAT